MAGDAVREFIDQIDAIRGAAVDAPRYNCSTRPPIAFSASTLPLTVKLVSPLAAARRGPVDAVPLDWEGSLGRAGRDSGPLFLAPAGPDQAYALQHNDYHGNISVGWFA